MAEKKQEKIEREYIIPLREKCRPVPRYKKTNKAIKTVKEFLARHMKVENRDLDKIKLDIHLNEFLWARGIRNPPHKVKVKALKENGIVKAELVDYPDKLKFKKVRIEKRELIAKEALNKNKTMIEKAKESVTKKSKQETQSEEDKKEETEKKSAVVEEGERENKETKKEIKKTTKIKSPEEEKDAIKEPRAK